MVQALIPWINGIKVAKVNLTLAKKSPNYVKGARGEKNKGCPPGTVSGYPLQKDEAMAQTAMTKLIPENKTSKVTKVKLTVAKKSRSTNYINGARGETKWALKEELQQTKQIIEALQKDLDTVKLAVRGLRRTRTCQRKQREGGADQACCWCRDHLAAQRQGGVSELLYISP